MVEHFEANCIGMHVHEWRLKIDPWRWMLLNIRKILQGGDLTGFWAKASIWRKGSYGAVHAMWERIGSCEIE